jgi:CRISPR-associated exonuclease Cas4/CRISPR-associated protein Cas1
MTAQQTSLALPAPAARGDEPLVPARMVNEWLYCARLAYLEWVEGAWAPSADTEEGARAHAATERGDAPPVPDPADAPDLVTRRLSLASERLGLAAEIDVLEVEDGAAIPVDHKKGKRPHVPEGAYLPERAQVAVQGVLLREAGFRCDEGALWFAASRERVRVMLSDELVATALAAASELRLAAAARRIPPPLENSPKCTRCSLLPICLPDEVNLFRTGAAPRTPPPPADAALPLYVQAPGGRVGRSGDTFVITVEGEAERRVPIGDVSELILAGPVGVTTPALHEAARRDIPIAWMSSGFWFVASTGGRGPRSAAARRAQYAAAADPAAALRFARGLVTAKIRNQRTMLRRNWRGPEAERDATLERLRRLADRAPHAADRGILLGLEGEAASLYFAALPSTFTEAARALGTFDWAKRSRRPPADPLNACLSLAYALLARITATVLEIAGLDPWIGLYHVERPGRPALALDMMEPLRPILADSAVLMAVNNGELGGGDFVRAAGGCALTPAGRRALIRAWERRLEQEQAHPLFGYQVSMRRMLHVQARLLAKHLGGELDPYPHYVPR